MTRSRVIHSTVSAAAQIHGGAGISKGLKEVMVEMLRLKSRFMAISPSEQQQGALSRSSGTRFQHGWRLLAPLGLTKPGTGPLDTRPRSRAGARELGISGGSDKCGWFFLDQGVGDEQEMVTTAAWSLDDVVRI